MWHAHAETSYSVAVRTQGYGEWKCVVPWTSDAMQEGGGDSVWAPGDSSVALGWENGDTE